jgi:Zn-finger nucleic acid-binding protein
MDREGKTESRELNVQSVEQERWGVEIEGWMRNGCIVWWRRGECDRLSKMSGLSKSLHVTHVMTEGIAGLGKAYG